MNIRDFLIEEVEFSCTVHVASVDDVAGAQLHWSGELLPGMEGALRAEDGILPDWFSKREVTAIGATRDGCLMIIVE